MDWYWIVLIYLGYQIMWTLTSILYSSFKEDDAIIAGLMWPIFLPVGIVIWFVNKYGNH